MALSFSTGHQTGLLDGTGLNAMYGGGKVLLLSGAAPATADTAQSGTLLAEATLPAAAAGVPWSISGKVATLAASVSDAAANSAGTIGYFRVVGSGDTGVLSTTQPRFQGTVATSGGDMTVNTVTVSSTSDTVTITTLTLTMP